MENEISCSTCRCKPVCKEKERFKEYVKQHIELGSKYDMFDCEPECPYYIAESNKGINETKDEATITDENINEDIENILEVLLEIGLIKKII